jgi:hypothetical protein
MRILIVDLPLVNYTATINIVWRPEHAELCKRHLRCLVRWLPLGVSPVQDTNTNDAEAGHVPPQKFLRFIAREDQILLGVLRCLRTRFP